MNEVNRIIEGIDRLKPIPEIAQKVMSIAKDPMSSMGNLADIIQYDQALTANLLRICNSSFFGLPRKIDSIHQAVTLLGMGQVVDMLVVKMSSDNLKKGQKGYDLRKGDLWKYSVLSALMAKEIAEKKASQDRHLIFTAALLKDIGKVILSESVEHYFEEIDRMVTEQGMTFQEAEKAVIGIDHAELGAKVAEKWKFSEKMVSIIRHHHLGSSYSGDDIETAIVYLADTLCMMMGVGAGSDGLAYRFHESIIEQLQFSESDLQNLMASYCERLSEVEELIQQTG